MTVAGVPAAGPQDAGSTPASVPSSVSADATAFDAEDKLLDSKVEDPKPVTSGRRGDKRAATASTPEAAIEAEKAKSAAAKTQPAEKTPAQTQPQPAAADIDADTRQRLADARLREVPGETKEAALVRLAEHWRVKSSHNWQEVRDLRAAADEERAQQQQFRAAMEPILRDYYRELTTQQREEAIRQIPDKETDPQGYSIWLQEQQLIRDSQREQAFVEQQRLAAEQSAEEQQQHAVLDVDEYAVASLEYAVANDPEAEAAYDMMTGMSMAQMEQRYPSATPEQLAEAVQRIQLMDMRNMLNQGIDPMAVMKNAAAQIRQMVGAAPYVPAEVAPPDGNGNGSQTAAIAPVAAAAPAATQTPVAPAVYQPAAPTSQPTPQPVAARLAREAAIARQRAAVSSAGVGGSAPTGEKLDIRGLSEDEFVELGLDGAITDQDIFEQLGKRR